MTEVLTYEALKAERDALAVENAAPKDINAWCKTEAFQNMYREFKTAEAIGCTEVDCMHDAMLVAIMHAPKTPATSAALAVIQAQGVEKLADKLDAEIEQIMRGAFFYDEISSREAISKMVREYVTELREAI